MAAREWLAGPRPGWALAAATAAAVAAFLALASRRPRVPWLAGALLLAGAGLVLVQTRIDRVRDRWDEERERRITAAGDRLAQDLDQAFDRLEALSERARGVPVASRRDAFRTLADMLPEGDPEMGVVVLEPSGVPLAWAGSHHRIPEPGGPGLSSRVDGYYLLLESRRVAEDGRVAVATVLVWAHPAAPGTEHSLAEGFRRASGVGLAVYAPGTAPDDSDVFDYDYADPDQAGARRRLFSVRLEPPAPQAALAATTDRARRSAGVLLALVVAAALAAAPPAWRFAFAALALALLDALVIDRTRRSGVTISLLGTMVLFGIAAIALARFRRARAGPVAGWLAMAVGAWLLAAGARGFPTPRAVAGAGPWLTWHLVLAVPTAALLFLGASLVRPSRDGDGGAWPVAGGLLAVAAFALGVAAWQPGAGLAPPAALAAWVMAAMALAGPARVRARLAGCAIVAGAGAGFLAWSALQQTRTELAERDVARLAVSGPARAAPPVAAALAELAAAPAPSSATELFVRWRATALSDSGYPAQLALRAADGQPETDLALDSLELPAPLLASLAGAAKAAGGPAVTSVVASPGVHHVGVAPLPDGRILTLTLGPRTRLIGRTRLGTLLLPPRREATYRLTMGLAVPGGPAGQDGQDGQEGQDGQDGLLRWHRERMALRAERLIELPDGARTVQAVVPLRGPGPMAVRLALVLALDVAVLGALWWLAGAALGRPLALPEWRLARRSFRLRLALVLAGFFLVPALAFTTWGLARLRAEAERSRDRDIAREAREAAGPAARLLRGPDTELAPGLAALAGRFDAEFALYSGGALLASSAPILRDLGVIQPLLEPGAFVALAVDGQLDQVRPASPAHGSARVGYRVVQAGAPSGMGVLAAPRRADVAETSAELTDLALALLLAALAGALGAAAGARLAARTLALPLAELRESALAIGAGNPPPAPSEPPPAELEPVFGAMTRMEADIRATQAELEDARARTAAVLATVATGVVALDARGRVLLANPRAEELLGLSLPAGTAFIPALPAGWAPVRETVGRAMRGETPEDLELEAGGRLVTLQAARLGRAPGGLVLAFNDVTQSARAARVLAWGEMARQVAHEIKNPLTPLRLGVQHLRRAWHGTGETGETGETGGTGRRSGKEREQGELELPGAGSSRAGSFGAVLEETSARFLGEIDRLDTIARIFSRFGAPPEEAGPLEAVDLTAVAGEVVQLYALAEDGARVQLTAEGPVIAAARKDEVKEVLVNLLENARNAAAREVVIDVGPAEMSVRDDGSGIPAVDLVRVFEPRFSTTTRGAGLGLAIVRRLVEGWGATVRLDSEPGRGTIVRVTWPARTTEE